MADEERVDAAAVAATAAMAEAAIAEATPACDLPAPPDEPASGFIDCMTRKPWEATFSLNFEMLRRGALETPVPKDSAALDALLRAVVDEVEEYRLEFRTEFFVNNDTVGLREAPRARELEADVELEEPDPTSGPVLFTIC